MPRPRNSAPRFGWVIPPLLLLVMPTGCSRKGGIYSHTRSIVAETDDFGMMLLRAGLEPEALPGGEELSPEDAERLRLQLSLMLADGNMQQYGPRITADRLLAEVPASGGPVPRAILNERIRRFEKLTVLRPDGYLASVITGLPVQCVGPVQVQDGAMVSGDYKIGPLYTPEGAEFREGTSLPRAPASSSPAPETEAPQKPK